MSMVEAVPMSQVKEVGHPEKVYDHLMGLIIRLAEHGLVHGDFNEFNLMINEEEEVTMIDFPQMTSTSHLNAEMYFDRDVNCVNDFFYRKFGLKFEGKPVLEKVIY